MDEGGRGNQTSFLAARTTGRNGAAGRHDARHPRKGAGPRGRAGTWRRGRMAAETPPDFPGTSWRIGYTGVAPRVAAGAESARESPAGDRVP